MLAWVRTATTLITFGFSIQQFFRIARQGAGWAPTDAPPEPGGTYCAEPNAQQNEEKRHD
jgi:hypothetical protein